MGNQYKLLNKALRIFYVKLKYYEPIYNLGKCSNMTQE